MKYGVVLFTSDRGITLARAAQVAEEAGFDSFAVPEHTHIPVRRQAPHPGTGDSSLPDDRYLRTLDPWVALATAAAVTSTIRLRTAVALPAEHDPIGLAKTIASLDHLSGGRVTLGVGFGWNTDELADHGVPADRRRTVLREHLDAMRALWFQEEASYQGEFVSFGPSWAWPKPAQSPAVSAVSAGRRYRLVWAGSAVSAGSAGSAVSAVSAGSAVSAVSAGSAGSVGAHVPVQLGAGGTERNFRWIAKYADGWITTPRDTEIELRTALLHKLWRDAGRDGLPSVTALAGRPDPAELARWDQAA